jgi:hypothetical protein
MASIEIHPLMEFFGSWVIGGKELETGCSVSTECGEEESGRNTFCHISLPSVIQYNSVLLADP